MRIIDWSSDVCSADPAVLVSERPRIAAWPLALSALAHGGWLAWREARAVRGELVIAGEGGRKRRWQGRRRPFGALAWPDRFRGMAGWRWSPPAARLLHRHATRRAPP